MFKSVVIYIYIFFFLEVDRNNPPSPPPPKKKKQRAYSERHPHTPELWCVWGTITGTLLNVMEALVTMAMCVRQSSPNFTRLRQGSHAGTPKLPSRPSACLIYGVLRHGLLVRSRALQDLWLVIER